VVAEAMVEVLEERGIAMGPDGPYKSTLFDHREYTKRKTAQPKVYQANSMKAIGFYPRSWNANSEAAFARIPQQVADRVAQLRAAGQTTTADAVEKTWLENAGMMVGPAKGGGSRGWQYSTDNGTGARINIPSSRKDDMGLYVHEWGHRMEAVMRYITRSEWVFRHYRAEGKGTRWLGSWGNSRYGRSERAVDDKFKQPYAGKEYSSSPSDSGELLTMGMEGIYRGSTNDTGQMMLEDHEYRRFIMGLLALLG
jgi:hypothetical protein